MYRSSEVLEVVVPRLTNYASVLAMWASGGDDSVSTLGIRAYISVSNNGLDYTTVDDEDDALTFRFTEGVVINDIHPKVIPEGAEMTLLLKACFDSEAVCAGSRALLLSRRNISATQK